MNTKEQIQTILLDLLYRTEENPMLDDDTPLVTTGRLDSLRILELASRLEQAFGIRFSDIGFDQYEFDSLDTIHSLLSMNNY